MQITSSIISTININQYVYLTLSDETSHYFGGYYHVKVLAFFDVPLSEVFFGSNSEFMDARSMMGNSVRFERILEKMAVPENQIAVVRSQLVDAFNKTTLGYISTPDFAGRFVRSAYLKRCSKKTVSRQFPGH